MRAAASAMVTFGLVAVPVKMFVSASDEAVHFHMINPATGERVKQKLVDAVTGDEVDRGATLSGYEVARGTCVTFTKDELKLMDPVTTKTVDIQEFVASDTFDPICVEQTYYLGPDKGGDRGYTLLSEAMANEGVVAVAQWSARGKERLVAIAPYNGGLVLHVLWYAAEVRPFAEVLDSVAKISITEQERKLAAQLIGQLRKPTTDLSVYKDTYAGRVREAAEQKAAGQGVSLTAAPANPIIIDMYEALKRSIDAERVKATAAEQPAEREAV